MCGGIAASRSIQNRQRDLPRSHWRKPIEQQARLAWPQPDGPIAQIGSRFRFDETRLLLMSSRS
jgi:hypothetical protein